MSLFEDIRRALIFAHGTTGLRVATVTVAAEDAIAAGAHELLAITNALHEIEARFVSDPDLPAGAIVCDPVADPPELHAV